MLDSANALPSVSDPETGSRGADDVALLAFSVNDLQHALRRFTAQCVAAGMRISTLKSKAVVLTLGGGELLPQTGEFKLSRGLGVMSDGKMER